MPAGRRRSGGPFNIESVKGKLNAFAGSLGLPGADLEVQATDPAAPPPDPAPRR
jgi:hypothetical protein